MSFHHSNMWNRYTRQFHISGNRNIHMFSTLEECNDYITKCKEIIIHNLLSYYKTKISQYTTTVNKIESKIDDFLS